MKLIISITSKIKNTYVEAIYVDFSDYRLLREKIKLPETHRTQRQVRALVRALLRHVTVGSF